MPVIPPRLNSILSLLLQSSEPISVNQLSKELGTSRRTIFRELENGDIVLRKTELQLDTKVGEGILLLGNENAKANLASLLAQNTVMPQNKQERQVLLAFLLIDSGEMQKLYYYAKMLHVSEATVSLDMDALEERLNCFGLTLVRKQGLGAELEGTEENMRQMLVELTSKLENPHVFMKQFGHPSLQARIGIQTLLQEEWIAKLDWMTNESLEMLELQLAIMLERVQKHHLLTKETETIVGLPKQLAGQLCDSIESQFTVSLPPAERLAVGVLIRACRAKQLNPLDINDAAAYINVQNLAYRMIDSFDPTLSHSLKLNEDLVHGLSLHLWSAIVRLKKGLELTSIMQEQIKTNFPEVFEKSRQAAKVLEQELAVAVPDNEVAFIASHFGAALMHLGERSSRNIVLKAGIVCVAGIGVSYMMASQVRQSFKGELEVVVSDWSNPSEWNEYDLLISSIPLDYRNCPVVVVGSILSDEDYSQIREVIKNHAVKQVDAMPRLSGSLSARLDKASQRFSEMSLMLRDFSRLSIHADCSFDELAKMTGYRFGTEAESGTQLFEDLMAREAISTQVIQQLGIVLLHARTAGVSQPVVGLVSPENGQFTNSYFSGAKGCLVMLVPRQSGKDILEVFGYISGALVEDTILLEAVQNGDEAVTYTRIEAALLQYLQDYWNNHLNQTFL